MCLNPLHPLQRRVMEEYSGESIGKIDQYGVSVYFHPQAISTRSTPLAGNEQETYPQAPGNGWVW